MKKLTNEIIKQARDEYLKRYKTLPGQFSVAYSEESGWRVAFFPELAFSTYSESFITWMTDEREVLELFFSCDAEKTNYQILDESQSDEAIERAREKEKRLDREFWDEVNREKQRLREQE